MFWCLLVRWWSVVTLDRRCFIAKVYVVLGVSTRSSAGNWTIWAATGASVDTLYQSCPWLTLLGHPSDKEGKDTHFMHSAGGGWRHVRNLFTKYSWTLCVCERPRWHNKTTPTVVLAVTVNAWSVEICSSTIRYQVIRYFIWTLVRVTDIGFSAYSYIWGQLHSGDR